MSAQHPLLTPEDVAAKLKVHPSFVRNNWAAWHEEFNLPVIRLGNGPKALLRFRETDIDRMIKDHFTLVV